MRKRRRVGDLLDVCVSSFGFGCLTTLIVVVAAVFAVDALTLSQLLPLTGAVVVCTPQDVALLDAVKAIAMFRKVRISILGVIENVSGFVCLSCGQRHDIFGSGGARRRAEERGVPFLGDVPIQLKIREYADEGRTEANFAEPAIGACLDGICYRLVKSLAESAAAAPRQPSLPVLG